jgi:hypothetical protein
MGWTTFWAIFHKLIWSPCFAHCLQFNLNKFLEKFFKIKCTIGSGWPEVYVESVLIKKILLHFFRDKISRYFIFLSMHNCILFSRKCSVLKQIRYQVYFYTICLIFFWSCWFVSLTPKWRNYFLLSELILQLQFYSAILQVQFLK